MDHWRGLIIYFNFLKNVKILKDNRNFLRMLQDKLMAFKAEHTVLQRSVSNDEEVPPPPMMFKRRMSHGDLSRDGVDVSAPVSSPDPASSHVPVPAGGAGGAGIGQFLSGIFGSASAPSAPPS
jgi:hypothetical protein